MTDKKAMTSEKRMTGKIKTINSRGFGFISTKDDIDYFFHYTAYNGNWKKLVASFVNNKTHDAVSANVSAIDNLKVEFDVDKTAKDAPRAVNVTLIEDI